MQIERSNNEIVIRISSEMDSKRLQKVLNLIRYGELTAKSTATQKQVNDLSKKINKSWWKRNKSKFLK